MANKNRNVQTDPGVFYLLASFELFPASLRRVVYNAFELLGLFHRVRLRTPNMIAAFRCPSSFVRTRAGNEREHNAKNNGFEHTAGVQIPCACFKLGNRISHVDKSSASKGSLT